MFWILLLSAWTLLHAYVFWRASSVPWISRRISPKWLALLAAALWSSLFAVRFLGRRDGGSLGSALEAAAMDWMALLFLEALCLFVADLVTGFALLVRRSAPALRGWALLAGLALGAAATVQALRPPEVTDYEVSLARLPPELDGTVVVALSDLHLGSLVGVSWLQARVAQVEALRPDLIALLGDVVEGHGRPPADFGPALSRLRAPLGVWAVVGNHESHGGAEEGVRILEGAGIRFLRNRWVQVRPGLVLAGVDAPDGHRDPGVPALALGQALAGRPEGATLLLSHAPRGAAAAASEDVGLMLCGHTHGGQIWPFGYLVRLAYPMLAGRYRDGSMTVLVTRGAGTWGPRMRLWRRGEILRITLRSPLRTGASRP